MKEDDSALIAEILKSAQPSSYYYVLLILATLIASLGLITGSAATVIGAMIIAPLMGPILGLSLASVRGEIKSFYKALGAEWTGVVLCIAVGAIVAFIVHPENIDYSGHEIAARLRPTLMDLAIGVFAGWAGAYAAWRSPRGSGAAGVAIAVALVPPLAVTGLCLAGAASGQVPWEFVSSSFVLFLANFLTIELASTAVFAWAGLGTTKHLVGSFKAHTIMLTLLLVLTGTFLYQQLNLLITEHRLKTLVDQELRRQLSFMPGCALDSFDVKLAAGKFNILAVVNVEQELRPEAVARMETAIRSSVTDGLTISLVLRTVKSRLLNSDGVFRHGSKKKKNKSVQIVGFAIEDLLEFLPGFHLNGYEILTDESQGLQILVSMRGPKSRLTKLEVRFMEKALLYLIRQKGSKVKNLSLKVNWSPEQVQTSTQTAKKQQLPEDTKRLRAIEASMNEELRVILKSEGQSDSYQGCYVVEDRLFVTPKTGRNIRVVSAQLLMDGAEEVGLEQLKKWEKQLNQKLSLSNDEIVAPILSAGKPEDDNPQGFLIKELQPSLNKRFSSLCQTEMGESGGTIRADIVRMPSDRQRGCIKVSATAYTPEALSEEKIRSWRLELQNHLKQEKFDYDVRLTLRNSIAHFADLERP